jgi:hypothetical protein
MNLFQNPSFLNGKDCFYFQDKTGKGEFGNSCAFRPTLDFPYLHHNFSYKSDFCPIANNHVAVVEYIEGKRLMYTPEFGMPSTITTYYYFCDSPLIGNLGRERNGETIKMVTKEDDLPMFLKLDAGSCGIIQENNLFCSVLVGKEYEQDEEEYVLVVFVDCPEGCFFSFVDSSSSSSLKVYLSGHIQQKIECEVTFPKQEGKIFEDQRHGKTKRSKRGKRGVPTSVDWPGPIQIKSVREIQIARENERVEHFFAHLLSTGAFPDVNNLMIVVYTLSSFIAHTPEVVAIMKKIEKFLNRTKWSLSTNFFNLVDRSSLGKTSFLLRLVPIFYNYFNMDSLKNYDALVLAYINKFNDLKKYKTGGYEESIERKKEAFFRVRVSLVRHAYYLEHKYLSGGSGKLDTGGFAVFFKKATNDVQLTKEYINSMLEIDLIDDPFSRINGGFNYDPTPENVKCLKGSDLYEYYQAGKQQRKRKRNSSRKTRTAQIKYSNIFSEDCVSAFDIPMLKKSFSNPLKLFKQWDSSKMSVLKSPKQKEKDDDGARGLKGDWGRKKQRAVESRRRRRRRRPSNSKQRRITHRLPRLSLECWVLVLEYCDTNADVEAVFIAVKGLWDYILQ